MTESRAERTSDRLLSLLKQQGPQCAAQLADELGLTEQGVRRHLLRLTEQGLIAGRTERPLGRGRPQQVYLLTERGEACFTKNYPALCVDILRHMQGEYGPQAVGRVLGARSEELRQRLEADWPAELSLEERLERLTREFQAAGFDSVAEDGGDCYYLTHFNCPHLAVAREFAEVCLTEQDMIAALLGREVEVRCEGRVVAGAQQCRYRISKG